MPSKFKHERSKKKSMKSGKKAIENAAGDSPVGRNKKRGRPKKALSGTIEGPTAATIPVAEVRREAEQVEQEEMQKETEVKTPEKKPREHAEEEEEEEDEVVQESPESSQHTPEPEQNKPAPADVDIANFVVDTKVGPMTVSKFRHLVEQMLRRRLTMYAHSDNKVRDEYRVLTSVFNDATLIAKYLRREIRNSFMLVTDDAIVNACQLVTVRSEDLELCAGIDDMGISFYQKYKNNSRLAEVAFDLTKEVFDETQRIKRENQHIKSNIDRHSAYPSSSLLSSSNAPPFLTKVESFLFQLPEKDLNELLEMVLFEDDGCDFE
ncbi:hypothetical protein WR25_14145 [Diploscapter pachys]|uniref:Uncharacterized protein n=1 Tax=Diploscapter pachys TaxID=2018661 RepID=A0A2A2KPV7_9BILA|nr:hypothetical protein WR25_14145 [Diploscapter pachys]